DTVTFTIQAALTGVKSSPVVSRYENPEKLPPGPDTRIPICPRSKEGVLGSTPVKSPDDGIKREERGNFIKFKKRLRKFGKQIENVGE
ncbi:unnamed protein product, partial [Allacma fusca]